MKKIKLNKRVITLVSVSVIAIVLIVVLVILLSSRTTKKTPIDLTLDFMNNYKNATSSVINNISYPYDDNLTDSQLNRYKELIKSQYLGLEYEIVDENVNQVDAVIKVEFTVLDYASSYDKASSYLSLYESDLSNEKKNDYKLNEMSNTKEKVTYSIEFKYYKVDGTWNMTNLNSADYKKLAGVF